LPWLVEQQCLQQRSLLLLLKQPALKLPQALPQTLLQLQLHRKLALVLSRLSQSLRGL
jgi:hypothetical protein